MNIFLDIHAGAVNVTHNLCITELTLPHLQQKAISSKEAFHNTKINLTMLLPHPLINLENKAVIFTLSNNDL